MSETKFTPEVLARLFHETYERLAPRHGYETRNETRKPWEEVPDNNRQLMVDVAGVILRKLNYDALYAALQVLVHDNETRGAEGHDVNWAAIHQAHEALNQAVPQARGEA